MHRGGRAGCERGWGGAAPEGEETGSGNKAAENEANEKKAKTEIITTVTTVTKIREGKNQSTNFTEIKRVCYSKNTVQK